jgi:membrane protease subunit HflK
MQTILSRSRKIVIDARNGSRSMIYLPLDKLAEAVRAATPSATPAAGSAAAGGAAAAAGAGPTAGANNSERADQPERGRERGDQ